MTALSLVPALDPDAESPPERVPTLDEVLSKIAGFVGHRKWEIKKTTEDSKGLVFCELIVKTPAGYDEYSYMRKGDHPGSGANLRTSIDVTIFDDGIPGGRTLSNFDEATEQWIDKPKKK